jgi:hypothetical protein
MAALEAGVGGLDSGQVINIIERLKEKLKSLAGAKDLPPSALSNAETSWIVVASHVLPRHLGSTKEIPLALTFGDLPPRKSPPA